MGGKLLLTTITTNGIIMNIKQLRNKQGLSQVETAKLLDVHINTFILWERGVSKPSSKNLKKLKKVLKIKD